MNTQKLIDKCLGRDKDLIGKSKLLCTQCKKQYKSYILNSTEWNKLPIQYRSQEICLDCYKKITGHTPHILI